MLALVLSLLVTPAHAEDAQLSVCKAQRNQAMEWHLAAEAARIDLQAEVTKLKKENEELKKEKGNAEHKP